MKILLFVYIVGFVLNYRRLAEKQSSFVFLAMIKC